MAQKNEKEKSERINVGRRTFLKTAGVAPIAAGVVGGVAELEAQTSRVVGPGEVPITLMVNGKRLTLNVEPRVTLLNAIRNNAAYANLHSVNFPAGEIRGHLED